jgi:hypothetical protein
VARARAGRSVTSVASVRATEDVAEQLITLALFPSSGLSWLVRWPHGGRSDESEDEARREPRGRTSPVRSSGLRAGKPSRMAGFGVLDCHLEFPWWHAQGMLLGRDPREFEDGRVNWRLTGAPAGVPRFRAEATVRHCGSRTFACRNSPLLAGWRSQSSWKVAGRRPQSSRTPPPILR